MIYAYWTAGAREAHDGQTVFSRRGGGTRIGDRLSRRPVQVFSDPGYPGLGGRPVRHREPEQQPRERLRQRPAARPHRLGPGRRLAAAAADAALRRPDRAAGHAVRRQPGRVGRRRRRQPEDLVAGVDDGLLVTCLWYIREVDPQTLLLTGLTRDGVYRVEGGEVTGAVNNFRFNESPVELLDRFSARLRDRAELLPRVGRLLPADRDPGPARARTSTCPRSPRPSSARVSTRAPGRRSPHR